MSQGKKARVFSAEFKVEILERMLGGENVSALAREIKVGRNLLYYWKDAYVAGGPGALRTKGRPSKDRQLERRGEATTKRGELLQARKRVAELERKVGHQQMEIDFFVEALRRLDPIRGRQDDKGAQSSTASSENKRSKAD